ncbi:chemotaxis protein CheW [Insulibacter thermoxylanivorax]|uniref:Chemotaxis protein CheW n=1 Tax=Insulibacter thermoxylanivorax TaxID=2749268 RepID=A0A916QE23_9BACL|nr:chemotaxis protein CheW [Insulibacter thermoxylanivorax]GFR37708.1 chemotaxis protein CheW [Insulibacter thermoxylanivorax]
MNEDLKVVVFSLGPEEYGVEVDKVRTIERMQPITRVPKTPDFVKGVINLRGVVVPIIDLRERFGLEAAPYTDNTRIIVVNQQSIEVGLIVDSANDVVDVNEDHIEEPPEIVGGIRAKYLRGIAKLENDRLLVLLNLQEVLNKDEIIQLEQLGED